MDVMVAADIPTRQAGTSPPRHGYSADSTV